MGDVVLELEAERGGGGVGNRQGEGHSMRRRGGKKKKLWVSGLERSRTLGVERASLARCGAASLGCSGFWFGSKAGKGTGLQ